MAAASNPYKFTGSGAWNEAFEGIKVSDFPSPKLGKVVVIPSDASARDAVDILLEARVLCAPVRDVTVTHADATWTELYIGLVDMSDIVLAALELVEKDEALPAVLEADGEDADADGAGAAADAAGGAAGGGGSEGKVKEEERDVLSIIRHSNYFSTTPVTDIMHVFKWGPFIALEAPTSSMLDVMLILGKFGHHRVIIVQPTVDVTDGSDPASKASMSEIVREDRRLVNIITQSAVVAQIAANAHLLKPMLKRSLADLGLAEPRAVFSVGLDDVVYNAFRSLREHHVSAVPVVGDDGSIVGVISNRDIRLVVGAHYSGRGRTSDAESPRTSSSSATTAMVLAHMFMPVRSFLSALSAHREDIAHPAVSVKATDTLEHVIGRLVATHIHRVFVVNAARQPVAVVSLRDIISVFVKEPKDYFGKFFDDDVSA